MFEFLFLLLMVSFIGILILVGEHWSVEYYREDFAQYGIIRKSWWEIICEKVKGYLERIKSGYERRIKRSS